MAEIGARLREARMRAKIDINEVETRTKIRAKYLRAIENEEWDLLPGDVYIRSFLRTYGDYLGLDSRELVDEFRRQRERPSDHEAPPIAPPGRERAGGRAGGRATRSGRPSRRGRPGRSGRLRMGVPGWLVIGVVLAAVVVVLVLVGNNSSNNGTTPSTPAHAARPGHRAKRHAHHRAATRAPPRPKAVTLRLQPTGQVYVCLVAGSGQKLIPGQIFDVGQTIPTETRQKLLLTLGNANVKMTVNGVPVPVPASATAIGFRLSPGGHAPLPAAQQPRCT